MNFFEHKSKTYASEEEFLANSMIAINITDKYQVNQKTYLNSIDFSFGWKYVMAHPGGADTEHEYVADPQKISLL